MSSGKISLDRLTIIAHDAGMFTNYLEDSVYVDHIGRSKNYGFNNAFKGLRGELIEVGDQGKIRIDFNPNNANMQEVGKMLYWLKYPYLTRMDIAIDYFNIDLSGFEWVDENFRKRNYWEDGHRRLETLYIGAPSSDKRFRIYDKLRERAANAHGEWNREWSFPEGEKEQYSHHWRVEVQKRFKQSDNLLYPSEYLLDDMFDITPRFKNDLDLSFIENVLERNNVAMFLKYPESLSELAKNTKTKYKKLVAEAREKMGNPLKMAPNEVYKKEKSLLAGQLTDLFNKCQQRNWQ